jgi:hypothetical protein
VGASRHITGALLAGALLAACSGGRGDVGDSCVGAADCGGDLQCFEGVCTPECSNHIDCGDGYRCSDDGACSLVESAVGDPCLSEIQCGPDQACLLDEGDGDGDGHLGGTCREQSPGLVIGSACKGDLDCRSGVCSLGVCSQMCDAPNDCPPEQACTDIPRLLGDDAPVFAGCLPTSHTIIDDLAVDTPSALLRIPVPAIARSFALVAQVDDPDQLVGATRVIAPDGRLLYTTALTQEDFYANGLRYQPSFSVSTVMVPNTPSIGLQLGVYQIDVSSLLPIGGVGTAVPDVRVIYKLDTRAVLDLHVYFLNMADHPCEGAFDAGRLDAASAPSSPQFQAFLNRLAEIFDDAGVTLIDVTYADIQDRPDLDGLSKDRLGDLLSLSTRKTGINLFIVRSISPTGVQALIGGTPTPPSTPGTRASGVAIAAETLCYRSWDDLARTTAHALARAMGLFHNRDPDGFGDTIADSDESADNLMFFSEFGGTEISPGQADVLRRYPGLE